MEHTKALNALEPFVLLAPSANSPRAAANLITRATSAPNTFVFAELLETRNVQALAHASDEWKPYLTLLQIFAWGTWMDYQCTHGIVLVHVLENETQTIQKLTLDAATPHLPSLNGSQEHKLRQLTLLPLSRSPETLTYTYLQTALSLPTTRILEDLVISAIYAGLLTAKLDTHSQRVEVSSVAPLRDVPPHGIPAVQATLLEWEARCEGVLSDIEFQIREVRRRNAERKLRSREYVRLQADLLPQKDAATTHGGFVSGTVAGVDPNSIANMNKGKGTGKRAAVEEEGGFREDGGVGGRGGEQMYDDEMDIDELDGPARTSQRKTPRRGEGKFNAAAGKKL